MKRLLLLTAFLCACGANVNRIRPSAHAAVTGIQRIAGTGPNDLWYLTQQLTSGAPSIIEHWNGAAWTTVTNPAATHAINLISASSGKVWADMVLIDTAGATMVNLGDTLKAAGVTVDVTTKLVNAGGALAVNARATNGTPRGFLVNGTSLQELPAPPGDVLLVNSPTDIWSSNTPAMIPANQGMFGHDYAGGLAHFDGTQWTPALQDDLPALATAASDGFFPVDFPHNDIWIGCGAKALQFDGTLFHPLTIPMPSSECTFEYNPRLKKPTAFFFGSKTSGDNSPNYACDPTSGNCQTIDVAQDNQVSWHRETWNGTSWGDDQSFVNVNFCFGAMCTDFSTSQVLGRLDDGSVVIYGRDAGDNGPSLYVVAP